MRYSNEKTKFHTRILWILAAIFATLQLSTFINGYRATADDVESHYYALKGAEEIRKFANDTAESTGRIGHLLFIPFGSYFSLYSDSLIFRAGYLIIYAAYMLAGAKYVATLTKQNVTLPLFVLLISLNPQDWLHLPPNSFPQFIVPLTIVIAGRLYSQKIFNKNKEWQLGIIWLALTISMIATEYAIVLSSILMLIEFITRSSKTNQKTNNKIATYILELKSRKTLFDVTSLFAALLIYFSYRQIHPSTYAGVQPGGIENFTAITRTIAGHIYAGISASRFTYDDLTEAAKIIYKINTAPILVGLLAFYVLYSYIKCQKKINITWTYIGTALFFSAFVTTPLALSLQYQSWCTRWFSIECGYLDSRISYLGIISAACLLALKINNYALLAGARYHKLTSLITSGIVGIAATLTHNNNIEISTEMSKRDLAWDRAAVLSCSPQLLQLSQGHRLSEIVDPERRISYHPWFFVDDYWDTLISINQEKLVCKDILNKKSQIAQQLSTNLSTHSAVHSHISFEKQKNQHLLKSGWSHAEDPGVWSSSIEAEISVPLNQQPKQAIFLTIRVEPFLTPKHRHQTVETYINNTPIDSYTYKKSLEEHQIAIPTQSFNSNNKLNIKFLFKNATSPAQLGISSDPRNLGFRIKSISLSDRQQHAQTF